MQMTNLQLELLKTFSYNLNDKQISEIKDLLADYFARKVIAEMDEFWDENNWSNEKIEQLAGEHLRK